MGLETIDLFKGLIPLSMNNGGDAPGWLSNDNLRVIAWAVSSSVAGLLVGVWAYRSHIRPGRLAKQEAEMQDYYGVPAVAEVPEVLELSEAIEVSEVEVSEAPSGEKVSEPFAPAEEPEAPVTPEENH
ncbi:MAG: hypothetical protein COC03_02785 [Robiginitomaculum sp.]|nr:MAG: hypothetical protein COC03_02785 [Robiginitomaculum sp.]PHQ67519.1 MAG: hypothetical protein COB92_04010 [Robiginitomaculum sp.]